MATIILFNIVTAQTITKVKELNPNGNAVGNYPEIFVGLGKMFFLANNGVQEGLWVSDGTDAGTQFIEPFNEASNFVEHDGKIFFTGRQNSQTGTELYVTDGTTSGTYLFKDINSTGSSNPSKLHHYNGFLYFSATNGIDGTELWRTDGTSANTFQWLEFVVGNNGGNPKDFFNYKGKMYFSAYTTITGSSTMWESDGEVLGTDFFIDTIYSPTDYFVMNDTLYFVADGASRNLFKSDGTKQGTYRFARPNANGNSDCRYFTILNNKFYFVANNGNANQGDEMWVSDGTAQGTELFYEFDLNNTVFHPRNLFAHNGRIYFTALHPTQGFELWSTNGTVIGTTLLKNIHPTSGSSPGSFVPLHNKLYFIASDGSNAGLWFTDGTTSGTQKVEVAFATNANYGISAPVEYNGSLYFFADFDASGKELYRYDLLTGVEQQTNVASFNLFPNPADNNFSIMIDKTLTDKNHDITITNFQGQVVYKQKISDISSININTAEYAEGLYLVQVRNGSSQITKRLVVMH